MVIVFGFQVPGIVFGATVVTVFAVAGTGVGDFERDANRAFSHPIE
jgi:hypothetical protein